MQARPVAKYPLTETVDFVIVGSGAAGGVLAKQLSTRGYSVVVLEAGPRLGPTDFKHDEFSYWLNGDLGPKTPVTWRQTDKQEARVGQGGIFRASLVGGSSVHFTANFWRLHDIDFNERSKLGAIPGANLADWPISYADLEPYYTMVDWEVGVSGAPGPFDPPRSKPYPQPPLPVKSSGVLFERGALKLGLHPQPAPMAILSQPMNGRNACQHCGYCIGFGCEFNAKSSSLASVIPVAEATGKCEIRPNSYAAKVELDAKGRATGVLYFDADKKEQLQRARAVILSANGAETSKLLLMSTSSSFPDGLANSSGYVGKHLMFNGNTGTMALFEHPLNEYKSVQVTRILHDFYDSDPKRGFYGGGGMDGRYQQYPIVFSLGALPADAPTWGSEYKRLLSEYFNRTMMIAGHTTSLPVESNNVTLHPTVKDDWGLPALRITYKDHDDDLKIMQFMVDRSKEIADAAGAQKVWNFPVQVSGGTAHLLGTCRMGKDPKTSVIDSDHRTHDVPNLFLCDGSSMVTSGRGQPTMTIMALAFRAGERIADLAKRGEI
ncbi:MAG TPA: GMC family oxidoreductase [Gemmatimonadales bacterium]|jgi:choline dehydrogenase-like flavoprotein|nr:GMC family oxidoreductase [Gemmatimonadales bacterium]